ncbi:unnamed protein product [Heligmosomoides polygyrus]|uniref:Uncharacterized protein n=1 Tax=Heligmosomoides polygyrus TaxID=6339 RepID=A0A183FXM8_HELPZ|nr:unnamed protein product [Heligmosomoides polygyrus]
MFRFSCQEKSAAEVKKRSPGRTINWDFLADLWEDTVINSIVHEYDRFILHLLDNAEGADSLKTTKKRLPSETLELKDLMERRAQAFAKAAEARLSIHNAYGSFVNIKTTMTARPDGTLVPSRRTMEEHGCVVPDVLPSEIRRAISSVRNRTARCPDTISAEHLKDFPPVLLNTLTWLLTRYYECAILKRGQGLYKPGKTSRRHLRLASSDVPDLRLASPDVPDLRLASSDVPAIRLAPSDIPAIQLASPDEYRVGATELLHGASAIEADRTKGRNMNASLSTSQASFTRCYNRFHRVIRETYASLEANSGPDEDVTTQRRLLRAARVSLEANVRYVESAMAKHEAAADNVDEERRSSEKIQKRVSSNLDRADDIVNQAQEMLITLEQRMGEL